MQKTYFLLILLLSLESSTCSITTCGHPIPEGLRDDCSNGLVTATTDDVGNTPDSCCLARGIETYSDDYGQRGTDYRDYCIQIKKSKALEYVNLLEDYFKGVYLDQIILRCGSELVYDSEDPSFSSESSSRLSHIRTLNLWILFTFLLF